MKSVLVGIVAAAIVAIGAWAVLDTSIQRSAEQRFATEGVRL
jgi:hypothetical protein